MLAAGTGIGAIPAAIAGVLSVSKVLAWIGIAITGAVAIISTTVTQVQALNVETNNGLAFPDGVWPKAVTGRYDDASRWVAK